MWLADAERTAEVPITRALPLLNEENDDEHTVQWWAEQILSRLPVLHDILGMDMRTHSNEGALSLVLLLQATESPLMCNSSTEHPKNRYLWDPEGYTQYLQECASRAFKLHGQISEL